jgi:transposase-like protein
VRLILDGTAVKVRLDRKATTILLLVVIGVWPEGAAHGQERSESTAAWRSVLDDLIKRGLRQPDFLIIDGGAGLESALAAVWGDVPVQRCTVHKHRNLLAHAPERLHEEISSDYNDMIYAETREQIEARRKAFIRKWRVKHRAAADSLEEAGDRLFTFTRLPPSQWKSARTTNAIDVRFDQPIEIVPGSHAEQIYGREVEEEPLPAAWLRKAADVGGLLLAPYEPTYDRPCPSKQSDRRQSTRKADCVANYAV